jgi:hypothetical protein
MSLLYTGGMVYSLPYAAAIGGITPRTECALTPVRECICTLQRTKLLESADILSCTGQSGVE